MERRLSELALHFRAPTGSIASSDFDAINHVARKAGIGYDLWQQGLLTLLFARGHDGRYLCGESGLTLSSCRQIGKTYTLGTGMFIQCLLKPGLTVIWTAHHSRTSDQTFNDLADLAGGRTSLDEPIETTLRRSKAKLQQVIDDPDTPPGAISSLTKMLIEVSEKLEAAKKDQPSGLDLLAAEPATHTESEERHGAQII